MCMRVCVCLCVSSTTDTFTKNNISTLFFLKYEKKKKSLQCLLCENVLNQQIYQFFLVISTKTNKKIRVNITSEQIFLLLFA